MSSALHDSTLPTPMDKFNLDRSAYSNLDWIFFACFCCCWAQRVKFKGPGPPQSERRGLSCADILQTRGKGFFRCGCPHFLVQKNSGFFEIYDVSARTRGVSQWGHFADKEGGFNFMRTSFMDGPNSFAI